MKQFKLFFLLLITLLPIGGWALTTRSLHVATAGTLPNLISESEKYTIEELTLTGYLNGTDFRLLRDMAGCNYKGEETEGKLTVLDMSDAHIVAGGEKYVDTDRLPGGSFGTCSFTIDNNDELPQHVFHGCKFISFKSPNSVTSIGRAAFLICSSLTSVTIPNSVTNIDTWAFSGCSSLTAVSIPNSVTNIGHSVFYNCSSLTSLKVEKDNTVYDSRNNCNAIINTKTNELIVGCQNTIIPNSVTSIGEYAFAYCTSLTSIEIPNSVTSIGDFAFRYCRGLTSIEIPNSATSIGDYAFAYCTSLTSIEIPNSVTSIGDEAFYWCIGLTSVIIPNSVIYIGGSAFYGTPWLMNWKDAQEDGLLYRDNILWGYKGEKPKGNIVIRENTRIIVGSAFKGCGDILSATIPNSVLSIGSWAFESCSGLTSVTIGNSVTSIGHSAFMDCSGLTSVTIGKSVTSIGDYAFYGCSGLTSVTIPNSVTSIGHSAFLDCKNLVEVHVELLLPFEIPSVVFYNISTKAVLYVPRGTKDKYQALSSWSRYFKSIVEEDAEVQIISFEDAEVKRICVSNWDLNGDGELGYGEAAVVTALNKVFQNNTKIHSFNELQYFTRLSSIDDYSFGKNSGLTSITIPNSVTSIGEYAFSYCSRLTSITIPNSVTSIGYSVFDGCSSLTSIVVAAGNTVYDSRNSCNAIINTANNELIAGCKNTVIPNSVTSIGSGAFEHSSTLTSVTIPNSVTSIGKAAFFQCIGLTSITIPNSVTSIGVNAFSFCSGLTSINIPNSVMSIGDSAFGSCSGLTSIVVAAGNTVYDSRNGCNAIIKTESNELVVGCKNTVIPNSVTSIGGSAFSGCSGLTSITIPNSVTSIGGSAFSGCSGLTSITIPNSVTSIGGYAFYKCI